VKTLQRFKIAEKVYPLFKNDRVLKKADKNPQRLLSQAVFKPRFGESKGIREFWTKFNVKKNIYNHLKTKNFSMKFRIILTAKYHTENSEGKVICSDPQRHGPPYKEVRNEHELSREIDISRDEIIQASSDWQKKGTGFSLLGISNVEVAVGGTTATGGSSYFPFDSFLKEKQKHGLTNIKNDDNLCFLYASIHGLFYDYFKNNKNKERTPYTRPRIKYDAEDFKAPRGLTVNKVEKYERYWKRNITIFKYEMDHPEHGIVCQRLSGASYSDNLFLLLVINKDGRGHYSFVSNEKDNISWLIQRKGKENGKDDHKQYWCLSCLNRHFSSSDKRDQHQKFCKNNGGQRIEFPTPKEECEKCRTGEVCGDFHDEVFFKNWRYMQRQPAVIYMAGF
jgi:hypothetical protein